MKKTLIFYKPEYTDLAIKLRDNYRAHDHEEVDLVSEEAHDDIEYAEKMQYDEAVFIEDRDTVTLHDIKSGYTNRLPVTDVFYPYEFSPLRPGGTPLTRQLLGLYGDIRTRGNAGGLRVLDLGCGRGETAALLAEEYGAAVTGVDISTELIRQCKETYSKLVYSKADCSEETRSKADCPGIHFLCADAQALPFEDASFDLCVSECSFSVFPDPEQAFREVSRVLIPGGKLLLSDLWLRDSAAGKDDAEYSSCAERPDPSDADAPKGSSYTSPENVPAHAGGSAQKNHDLVNAGSGMLRNLYTRKTWEMMLTDTGFVLAAFTDVKDVLAEMYVQMILDLGLDGARREMGQCLERGDMKQVSYMLLAGEKAAEAGSDMGQSK